MSAERARVFSIPPGAAFLPTLASAMLSGALIPGWPDRGNPLSLSEATVFVPTRRAARGLAALLAEAADPGAALLPRIVPLGDVDDAEEAQLVEALAGGFGEAEGLPPAVGETTRRLVLARLVLAWAKAVGREIMDLGPSEPLLVPSSPADALAMAGDLGMLIDSLSIHGRTVDDVNALVPDEYSRYWDISRAFLGIAAAAWPAWCAERGVLDAALRRHRILLAEAERLRRQPPAGPMIAAGSTGSMPATAALLHAIARLPRGAVVLPGLDLGLDSEAWDAIAAPGDNAHPSHPQAVLASLLPGFGLAREDIPVLGEPTPELALRERFVSEALRPAETTHRWSTRNERLDPDSIPAALAGLSFVEAADDREEAVAIAVALREAVEDPSRVAALVTPDRTLAARVSAELRRWDIRVDDSAGQPLAQSSAGLLAQLVAEAAAADFEADALLALAAHPLCRLGLPRRTRERARAALEIGVLRGPALEPGLAALRAALPVAREESGGRHAPRPRRRLGDADWNALDAWLGRLEAAFSGFTPAALAGCGDLVTLPAAHESVLAALGEPGPDDEGDAFSGPDGEGLAALFDELREASGESVPGRLGDYPAFLEALMAGRVVRRAGETHRRIHIWGLLEARLLDCDLRVLGGLDEKTWPGETRGDAFLNRPMRRDLGLPAPERRIGQMAHDFAQALGAPRVVITRALKRGGDPTVPSRLVQRLRAVAGDPAWAAVRERGDALLALARHLDAVGPARPARRPAPLAPEGRVPLSLSVTEIETLVRDPYAIFARHVLELDPLDPVATEPDAALRGTLVHEAMKRFTQRFPDALPADPLAELRAIGTELFAQTPQLRDHKDVAAAWWPRFERMAAWIAQWEPTRRAVGVALYPEVYGRLALPLKRGATFELRAVADRIEVTPSGGFRVVDFKTGAAPTPKVVRAGFSPQLTLEAAMVEAGAFEPIGRAGPVEELLYVKLSGGSVAGKEQPVRDEKNPFELEDLVREHIERLAAMMDEYAAGERPFVSRPYVQYAKRYAPYDHLARVREWSLVGGGDEEGGA
ncbi:double-strand break repair protein AddB [Alsobacter sp. SYSU M60028]|uniref:Double-strand break repair protein AddB n=1 Tax=Alsobacter ponti TaxID=2962936 RepID=A0ABT1LBF6_9HYPH|nr:double-strand break repair protein AddB [Alsobacter ponti]